VSTLKTDAVTAVSTNADLSLDGLGTGGVSIASTLKMTKGGDIASASPLVIDTDGNYFDVTGTTNFSVMTVESGNFFMLQFDGALTITHGSGIELPGAANLTTATGDRLMCYATAANTVEVMSVETEAAASGGITLGTETDTSSGTTHNVSIASGTQRIIIQMDAVTASTGAGIIFLRLGDAGGLETTLYINGSGYNIATGGTTKTDTQDYFPIFTSDAGHQLSGHIFLTLGDSSNNDWVCSYSLMGQSGANLFIGGGTKALSAAITQIEFGFSGSGGPGFNGGSFNTTVE